MSSADASHKEKLPPPAPKNETWTLIVAAAGKGSRLGWHAPKTLYPVAGKPIVDHILETFAPFCAHTVLVVSQSGGPAIRAHLATRNNVRFAVQVRPIGMADAVLTGLYECRTSFCACVWGDQPYFSLFGVRAAMQALHDDPGLSLALPVIPRTSAYIHIQPDAQGGISHILQKREGDLLPEPGISDCSMFFFRTPEMREKLSSALQQGQLLGKNTGEHNFLPLFPLLRKVMLLPISETEYSPGINTLEEAAAVETMLKRKRGHQVEYSPK